MSRLPTIFASLRAANRKALMPFICAGHPRPGDTARLLPALQRAGASVVEIGYPFSDPVADGPVIAAAMHEALKLGSTVASTNAEIATARSQGVSIGIVAMVSISIVWRVGPQRFITDAKTAGVDGFIFPDVPLEESADLLARTRDAGLTASLLIAPTTDPARAAAIARASSGFIYLLARTGITGQNPERKRGENDPLAPLPSPTPLTASLTTRISHLRQHTDLPIAVGFGISTSAHVRHVVHEAGADAAIVGSALVKRLYDPSPPLPRDPVAAAESFVRDLATGLV